MFLLVLIAKYEKKKSYCHDGNLNTRNSKKNNPKVVDKKPG